MINGADPKVEKSSKTAAMFRGEDVLISCRASALRAPGSRVSIIETFVGFGRVLIAEAFLWHFAEIWRYNQFKLPFGPSIYFFTIARIWWRIFLLRIESLPSLFSFAMAAFSLSFFSHRSTNPSSISIPFFIVLCDLFFNPSSSCIFQATIFVPHLPTANHYKPRGERQPKLIFWFSFYRCSDHFCNLSRRKAANFALELEQKAWSQIDHQVPSAILYLSDLRFSSSLVS